MREKLIELIQIGTAGCPYHLAEILADYMISNGVTIQKWIPVTERLPEQNGHYLVCTRNEFYKTTNIAKANFRRHHNGWYGQGGHWANVTHWMPLPELPKEDKQ